MREVLKRPQVRKDIMEQADYLALTSMNASDRFLQAIQKAFRKIAETPGIGSPRDFGDPKLLGLRALLVPGFPKVGIYYLYDDETVEIVRVLHGARDVAGILGPERDEESEEGL